MDNTIDAEIPQIDNGVSWNLGETKLGKNHKEFFFKTISINLSDRKFKKSNLFFLFMLIYRVQLMHIFVQSVCLRTAPLLSGLNNRARQIHNDP